MMLLKAILAKLINGILYGLAFVVMGLALIVVAIESLRRARP
ncbi:MAG: hypothetical protein OEQ39_19020 [Gammaproteobacteria bacterium]|nr:hypothetical protein [Gammaproteobacteria bacterium]